MKKTLMVTYPVLVLMLFSCSKAKEAFGITTATWHVGTDTYTSTNVVKDGTTQVRANGTNSNSMQVFFSAIPATAGTYKVVSETKAGNNTLASNELAVEFNVGANDVYLSTGSGDVMATVTVDGNGNVIVDVPTIEVEHFAGAGSLGKTTGDGELEY
ncbi:hypothetical protein [Ferruginibacter albus]|uniref:hypothetical protein n=1 Tax=Ferruginibacter albus TaxID=2875540 RepID=UPI001CC68361|nr:hypothetical protein [Ferruginibacter albus]UAY52535.1 hypothetical protein K9M53_02315 [Ferruginibacter albus]